jgi:hypothetical protein
MDVLRSRTELLTNLHPNIRLLLHCFTTHLNPQPGTCSTIDTNAFLHLLDCHRLSTIFYQHIGDADPTLSILKEQLHERYTANKFRLLVYVAELCRIIKLFNDNGIQTIALKGPVLGQLYYDDYTSRECNDLDIMVRPIDIEAAYQLLLASGYELSSVLWNSPKQKAIYTKTFYHYNLFQKTKGIQVELHWRLNASIGNFMERFGDIWNRLATQQIGGLSVSSLSKTDNFIYLCIHGSTHEWKRLFWVQDIAQIIKNEGHWFLEEAYQQAVEQKVSRFVLAGCHIAAILFDSNLPPIIEEAIQSDSQMSKLAINFIFTINHTTDPYQSPVSSFQAFKLGSKKLLSFYESMYYLGGYHAIFTILKRFFVNPHYWRIYSFNDKLFALNYIAAPFLWIYTAFSKHRK